MKIYNGYERLPRNYTLGTDEYEYSMANGYLQNNMEDKQVAFDVFFRKVPNNGGYAIMAGLDKIIPFLENLKFNEQKLNYFKKAGYSDNFIEYLKNFKFRGSLYAVPDGTPVFPNEPIITVKAPLIDAQIIETAILYLVNGAMEHATAARRIIEATPKGVGVMEFGSRRADGGEAAIDSALYAIMAGCIGTSNSLAADMINRVALGTQAHSFIESYPTELEAFISYAKTYPNNCILLVDTIDTLRSGLPNAIKTFQYMKENNLDTSHIGIRIDSGDLAYLTKEARKMLDEAGFPEAKICISNALDAETIESLVQQGAKFNSIGVGDNISKPNGRMGCVYKEVALEENNEWIPKIKLSNDTIKILNPGYKELYRAYDNETGYAICDIIEIKGKELNERELVIVSPQDSLKRKKIKDFHLRKLQEPIFIDGKLVYEDKTIEEQIAYCNKEMETIYPEVKRTRMPHEYYVDGTEEYVNYKCDIINQVKQLVR